MKKRKGQFAISGTVSFIVVCALVVLAITVFAVINKITIINAMASDISRYCEVRGAYNQNTSSELDRLCQNSGMVVQMSISNNIKSGKIQLGESFTITLKSTAYIGIGGIVKIPISISASATGRGEKLWK